MLPAPHVDEVAGALDLSAVGIDGLIQHGILVRTRGDRLSGRSVHRYIAGHRPQLLDSPLARRLTLVV